MPEIRAVTSNRVVTVGLTEKGTFEQSLKGERKLAVLIAEGNDFCTDKVNGQCKR